MNVNELQDNSDWRHAFEYALEPQRCAGDSADLGPANLTDVTDVIGFSNGYNEGDEWVGVFLLRDGRYLFLAAGCDNTGWDCSSSGHSWVASDYETLFTFGMGADMRERLRLSDRFDLDATREVRAATGCSTVAVFVNGDRVTVQVEAWSEHCERADAIECVAARLREGGSAS